MRRLLLPAVLWLAVLVAGSGWAAPAMSLTVREEGILPAEVTVPFGDIARLTFLNEGAAAHRLSVSGYDATTRELAPGEGETLTFEALKGGAFRIGCIVPGHTEAGRFIVSGRDELAASDGGPRWLTLALAGLFAGIGFLVSRRGG